jgi:hypothetical protein
MGLTGTPGYAGSAWLTGSGVPGVPSERRWCSLGAHSAVAEELNLHGVLRRLPRTGGVWLNPRGYATSVVAAIGSHRLDGGRFGTEAVLGSYL